MWSIHFVGGSILLFADTHKMHYISTRKEGGEPELKNNLLLMKTLLPCCYCSSFILHLHNLWCLKIDNSKNTIREYTWHTE